ncbi:protein MAINTENANCE OF MERISTEMS-like isoform X1 [Amborella trichopoda]|uniref:protein MAINTENANCE OF MERISTEMS-like isoform X1 n=1 Tax=Amborella trichopoda TaxID=13333 RepID=UPI0009BE8855|nr:protein MAINTENANCE OF MERISTEMS-like isoform X1 [Amborella trichopoda]|eukprot:XP_020528826.1 protein MAINTENANCE OF MERISTEMS-like isoform X1 [Amborella trichopoda]
MQDPEPSSRTRSASTSSDQRENKKNNIRINESTKTLGKWELDPRQVALIEKSNLISLKDIGVTHIDCSLLRAFIGKWCKVTNTSWLTVGEMTPTLYDVWHILRILVIGKPVTGIRPKDYKAFIIEFLGNYHIGDKLNRLKHTWLRAKFEQLPKKPTKIKLLQHTRAYLLYLVGTTIFADTSQDSTLTSYLQLFGDLDEAEKYAWGATTLTFLYGSLSKIVDGDTHFSGSTTLLQRWIYEHFPALSSKPTTITIEMPRASKWKKQPRDLVTI